MREQPTEVLSRLQYVVESQNQMVLSAISYAELRYGTKGKKASPKHAELVDEFLKTGSFDRALGRGSSGRGCCD